MSDTLTNVTKPPAAALSVPRAPSLENPYLAYEKLGLPHMARVNTCVDSEVIRMLMSMHPRPPGVVKNTVNILIHKLITELRRRNITTSAQQNEFIHFVSNCELGLPGELIPGDPESYSPDSTRPTLGRPIPDSTVAGSHGETAQPHDSGRAPGNGGQPPRPPQQQGGVQPPGKSAKGRGQGQQRNPVIGSAQNRDV